ncbi:regulatory LuxR family protein [Actinomycetospora cinnamomea]|uniref:Regulatory LuxR family protein n=1 Tax=Actinomycetospora cinnamomea TaxID=663609 RepID=A0A2U1FQY6_9PSEU|nr:regulatory LuxR family protein [Actinomycetospora cinnamomea]
MRPGATLADALAVTAATACVRSAGDLAVVVWPRLAELVRCDRVVVVGFDGVRTSWPGGSATAPDHPGYRARVVLEHAGTRARLTLHRGDPFDEEDLALLHLVRPHLRGALWRAAHGAGPSPLTPRQLRVMALVARGATDRAIAHELGISRRTVGKHLENAYAVPVCTTAPPRPCWWTRTPTELSAPQLGRRGRRASRARPTASPWAADGHCSPRTERRIASSFSRAAAAWSASRSARSRPSGLSETSSS